MQPLYYYLDPSNKLATSPSPPIISHDQETAQGKFTQRFFNSNGELIETLKCKLENGIPKGSATKIFPNGDRVVVKFNNQGMMESKAEKRSAEFFKELALGEEDKKHSEETKTTLRTSRHERKYTTAMSSPTNVNAPAEHSAPIPMKDGKELLLDPKLVLQIVCPKNSAKESAFRFCHNGNEVPVDLKEFVLKFNELLNSSGIILSEFNLIGGTLQRALLQKKKKQYGDIDFLGVVKTKNGTKIEPREILAIFSKVLDDVLFKQNTTNPQESIAKFRRKPFILKAFTCNQDFLIATIPLHLQDPNNPLTTTPMDIDIRINFEQKTSSCISSANCFKCDLLLPFQNYLQHTMSVTGTEGYENSVFKAFQLLQKGLFFVHESPAASTINGLRAYVVLIVKGLFPCDFRSSRIYFLNWQKECEAKGSIEFGVNEFFLDLGKFFPRHYSLDEGRMNLFSLSLYLINLRNLFDIQDWSEKQWRYDKEGFLKIFDMKSLYLLGIPGITFEDFSLLKMLIFWKIASQSDKAIPILIPNLKHHLALGSFSEGYGLMTTIPWKETAECNWEELEKRLGCLKPYLDQMQLPSNANELKGMIIKSITSLAFQAVAKNVSTVEELQIKKMFQIACQQRFDYGQFFCIFFDNITCKPVERAETLREFIRFIHIYNSNIRFTNLLNSLGDTIPNVFKAIADDLENCENGQKEMFTCLLKSRCDSFREEVILLIFSKMRTLHNDKFVCKMCKEVKLNKMTYSLFCHLLLTVFEHKPQRAIWENLLKYKLLPFLEAAQNVPEELLSAIFRLYDEHRKINPDVAIKVFLNLLRLGYNKKSIEKSIESVVTIHRKGTFHHFTEFVRAEVFTSQMLWEKFSSSRFNLEDMQFLNDLSIWCLERDETLKSAVEAYWEQVGKSHKLPQSILDNFGKVVPIKDVQIQEAVEESPAIFNFQIMVRAKIEEYEDADNPSFSDLSLVDCWMWLESLEISAFNVMSLSEEDLSFFCDLLYPKFKTAPINDVIPGLKKLFDLFPLNKNHEEYRKLFQKLVFEEALFEKSRDYILDGSTCVYTEKLALQVLLYNSQIYVGDEDKVEAKKQIVEALVKKSRVHPFAQENLLFIKDVLYLLKQDTPETFVICFQAFSEIMEEYPNLYEITEANELPLDLWEGLLESFYNIMNIQWLKSPDRLEWFQKMKSHYLKFDAPLTTDACLYYAKLSESLEFRSSSSILITQFNKLIEGYKKISKQGNSEIEKLVREKCISEWLDLWSKFEFFPSLEQSWDLFKIFSLAIKIPLSDKENISFFPTLNNKLSGFFRLQKLIFDSMSLSLIKREFDGDFEQNFKNLTLLHLNFINYYRWMYAQYKNAPQDKMLKKMTLIFRRHLIMHMTALTSFRHLSKSLYEDYGNLNFELFEFIVENQIVFKYEEALSLMHVTGFFSFDQAKRKKFLDVVDLFSLGCGAITLTPKFDIIQRQNIVILFILKGLDEIFVLKGLEELMGLGHLREFREYLIEMMALHPALSSAFAIDVLVSRLDEIYEMLSVPATEAQILKMICYAYFVIDICNSPFSRQKKYNVKLKVPIIKMPGMIKFLNFMEESNHPFVVELVPGLAKRLIMVSEEYEKWQNESSQIS